MQRGARLMRALAAVGIFSLTLVPLLSRGAHVGAQAEVKECAIVVKGAPHAPDEDGDQGDAPLLEEAAQQWTEFARDDLGVPPADILTTEGPTSPEAVREMINTAKARGCKRLFLFIAAHGGPTGIDLTKLGTGDVQGYSYGQLGDDLEAANDTLDEVYTFIYACKSGAAHHQLQGRGFDGEVVSATDEDKYCVAFFDWAEHPKEFREAWRERVAANPAARLDFFGASQALFAGLAVGQTEYTVDLRGQGYAFAGRAKISVGIAPTPTPGPSPTPTPTPRPALEVSAISAALHRPYTVYRVEVRAANNAGTLPPVTYRWTLETPEVNCRNFGGANTQEAIWEHGGPGCNHQTDHHPGKISVTVTDTRGNSVTRVYENGSAPGVGGR